MTTLNNTLNFFPVISENFVSEFMVFRAFALLGLPYEQCVSVAKLTTRMVDVIEQSEKLYSYLKRNPSKHSHEDDSWLCRRVPFYNAIADIHQELRCTAPSITAQLLTKLIGSDNWKFLSQKLYTSLPTPDDDTDPGAEPDDDTDPGAEPYDYGYTAVTGPDEEDDNILY